MGASCVMGTPYTKGSYDYYPTVLYAAGNACLYNAYAYPDIDGYIFTQAINQTFRASYYASTKSLTINTGVVLKAIAKARNATRQRFATPRAITPRRRSEARWHSSSNISICLLLSVLGALP